MIIELVTPIMIATAPMRIDVPENKYSHFTQTTNTKVLAWSTYSGTQTFDYKGHPYDSDND
jgi:hypothetical protein